MKVLVQHTFNSGLGDFLNCIYEYFHTCNNLKKLGYNDFSVKFYIKNNVYLHEELFFYFFKKETFSTIFKDIEIINQPITSINYENMISLNDSPGIHLWDLFIEDGYVEDIKNHIVKYSYDNPKIPYIDLFTNDIIEKYKLLKTQYNLNDYVSIYLRTFDLQDNENTYINFESKLNEIVKNNNKIYVSSNSYLFKKYIKKYSEDKIVMYDIPGEDVAGNHYNYNRFFYHNKDMIHLRTEFVIFEMLTLSESKNINFFTLWGRGSNFLLLSRINETPINTTYI